MSQLNKLDVVNALPKYYLPYAQYVNQTRALPDARDCLKTGTRFILYAQYLEKLTYDKPRRKAVDTESAAMKFSPHGNASILGAAVRLSQPFSMRYPLIYVKGNNGSQIDGSGVFSADRYLEMQSNKLASEMTSLLKKNTIENWEWNYTQDKQYPVALPSLFPNFVNGCTGIGVGMACSIPQFNLKDVCDSAIKYLENPDATFEELYCPIDFCTGGTIINETAVKESLKHGTGSAAIVRAKIVYDSENKELAVTELPYQATSKKIVQEIQQCIEEGLLVGVDSVFDGSDINGVRVCIKLTKTANTEKTVKILYKETSLQSHFGINMVMLKDGKLPLTYGFIDILKEYLSHMQMILKRSYEYDLEENKNKLEILEGYAKAIVSIDDIVALIKNSKTKELAIQELIKVYKFTERQAKAIMSLQLQRLVNMEFIKLQSDIAELKDAIKAIELVINDEVVFRTTVKNEIKRISKEYGDERRTVNMTLGVNTQTEEVLEEKNLIVYFTNYGNLYADECSTLMAQRKGGKGNKIKMQKGETIIKSITGKNTSSLLAFSNIGRAFSIQLDEILDNNNIYSLFDLESDEKIIEITMEEKAKYIVFITKNGLLKKSKVSLYNMKRRGVNAIKLVDGDSLVKVLFINEENVALLTHGGIFKMIDTTSINPIGRVAQGVICAKLDGKDYIVDARIVEQDSTEIIAVSQDGLGARYSLSDFGVTGRATKGKQLQKGEMAGFALVSHLDKEIAVSSNQSIIKVPIGSISLVNRGATGSKIINTKEKITGVIKEL